MIILQNNVKPQLHLIFLKQVCISKLELMPTSNENHIGRKLIIISRCIYCLLLLLSFNVVFAQIENNNPSLKFPNNQNENNSPLYIQPEESPYFQRDFLKKDPIDMTDPTLENAPNITAAMRFSRDIASQGTRSPIWSWSIMCV